MRTAKALAAIALAVSSALACAGGLSMPGKAAASAPAMPLVQAEVRKVDPKKGMVVLRHGEIPNLAMPAMTMGFDVAGQRMLDGLKAGDKVRFQAEMVKGKATVTELKRE